MRLLSTIAIVGGLSSLPASGQCGLSDVLTGSQSASGDRFGADAIAVAGGRLLVGASREGDTGAAYFFDGPTWQEVTRVVPSLPSLSIQKFGSAVALDGDTAVVGARSFNNSVGIAYVYERSASTWTESTPLHPPHSIGLQLFGASVAIEAGQIFVGRQFGIDPNAVHVYELIGGTWQEVDELNPSTGEVQFGLSMAVDGDTLLVGAYQSAYVFERIGGVWTEVQVLASNDPQTDDAFGWSVDLQGDVALVGDIYRDTGSIETGAAYVFRRDAQSGTWASEGSLVPADLEPDHWIGAAVAIDDGRAYVGAVGDTDRGGYSGSVYVFEWGGSTWSEVDELYSPIPSDGDFFGSAIGRGDGSMVVGGFAADYVAVDSAWIGDSYCLVNANSTGSPAAIQAIGECEAAANDLILSATRLPPNKFGYFLLSETQAFFPLPGGSQGNLCIGGTIGRFQALVQNSGPAGEIAITVDLTNVPLFGAITAGETWNFTCWYRDVGGNSNFTGGITIPFG